MIVSTRPPRKLCAAAAAGEGRGIEVRNVWDENLEDEFAEIEALVTRFPFIGLDTEFPGVAVRPVRPAPSKEAFHYATLKLNADMLKLIYLGIVLCDKDGNMPEGNPVWQFNFRFSKAEDVHAPASIALLEKAGLDLETHAIAGIDPFRFAELFVTSGLVLMPDVRWITFHAGYDLAYMLRLLTQKELPNDVAGFLQLCRTYFPQMIDLKFALRHSDELHGGLARVAKELGVERRGTAHQAGSDGLMTAQAFFALVNRCEAAERTAGGSGKRGGKGATSGSKTGGSGTGGKVGPVSSGVFEGLKAFREGTTAAPGVVPQGGSAGGAAAGGASSGRATGGAASASRSTGGGAGAASAAWHVCGWTYGLVSDGDLEKTSASMSASLAREQRVLEQQRQQKRQQEEREASGRPSQRPGGGGHGFGGGGGGKFGGGGGSAGRATGGWRSRG